MREKAVTIIVLLLWVCMGIIKYLACFCFFKFLGLNFFLAAIAAFAVAWLPYVGSILAVIGAVKAWEWNIINAILLFIIIGCILTAAKEVVEKWGKQERNI